MNLVLEIEYLLGVSFAANGPDSPVPDWPPQPDRVFSALVATWAMHGEETEERAALEWLEQQPPPRLLASAAEPRTAPTVYVPPNDPRSDRQKNAIGVLPASRNRQPRRFPAAWPYDPVVRFVWAGEKPESNIFSALQQLARDIVYVGHSASLTRCRFLIEPDTMTGNEAKQPARNGYRGRLEELRREFDAGRRPRPGARVAPPPVVSPQRTSVFADGAKWLILEHIDGVMPDIRACALVAKALRDTLLSGYRQIGLEDKIPPAVSGHESDRTPARNPHLAILPMPHVGSPYADGHAMGYSIIPPRDQNLLADEDFRNALRILAPMDEKRGRRILTLTAKVKTSADRLFSVDLSPTFEPPAGKVSLDPARYVGPARDFATVTPIVLDRHLKEKGAARDEEIVGQIAAACRHIGLPEPEAVVADKHSAIEGVPSANPSRRSPPWMRWRLPPSLASRQLTHAVIRFAAPVDGPVILGAGRFVGLGFCRPLAPERQ